MRIIWRKRRSQVRIAVRLHREDEDALIVKTEMNKYSFIKYISHKNKKVVDIYAKSGMIT